MADFAHLHLHTQYSFLDGAIHMSDLCPRVKELGMSSVAVTEHGNLFGAIDFYRRAKEQGIKPILGVEAYVAEGARTDKTSRKNHHLVLLAASAEGYKNLTYLVSMGYVDGFYYKPRIDKALLKERSKGLIALTACLGGEVAQSCVRGDLDHARSAVRDYKSIFEPDHFFLELQENGLAEQKIANDHIKQLARDEAVPLIATNDCHYKMREDAAAHDVLMCIQHGRARNDPSRSRHQTDAFYIRSPAEMEALFSDCPEAVANTLRVRDMVNLELKLDKPMLPTFVPPDGSDLETHLRDRARRGLERRYSEMPYAADRERYAARLEEELGIIVKMKFPGYFLIVADFINWAKEHQIPVGPGRGSGAGSLVAYALRITDLDPLPYNLLFERFLNPERISMPDFDVDFCQERRGEVIQYVSQRYGHSNVGQIATFAQLKAKSVIKDVARALEVPFADVNAITTLLPNTYKSDKGDVKPITIDKALEIEPRLRALEEEKPVYHETLEIARRLEGLYRQAGMHAAGIVIADSPLWDVVPVFRGKDDELVSQFSMSDVEHAGLVKFDFLGLKTLDVIDYAERHVNQRIASEIAAKDLGKLWAHPHIAQQFSSKDELKAALVAGRLGSVECSLAPAPSGPEAIDLTLRCSMLPLDDAKVYRLLASGETIGVFQLESTGFQELLKRLRPDCFEDIIAAVALYRPGPLQTGMVDDFIDCKHGRQKIRYPHPLLEPVLKPTYGGFVYQEQVMQAAQVMARYSLGGADLLRRAMGKKKLEVMQAERAKFVAGCTEHQISEKESGEVFDLMEKFAGYGFNKSHSAAYALVTYQTAFLKTYYPVEFMAALLSTELTSTDNIVKYIAEAKSMGIAVLPATVNDSDTNFTVPEQKIRFGLGAIKGLGEGALDAILTARASGGAFRSLYDFCERVPLKHINKKTLETLVRSGAFDCFRRPRAQLMEALDRAIEAAKSTQRDQATGQVSLFALPELAQAIRPREVYDDNLAEWPELERLKLEKEAIGFYITAHPLDRYASDLKRYADATVATLEERAGSDVVLGVSVSALRERPLKDGSGRMAFILIEDLTGAIEMMVPSRVFAESEALLKSEQPLLIKAAISVDRGEDATTLRARCTNVRSLADTRSETAQKAELCLEEGQIEPGRMKRLRSVLRDFPGRCRVAIRVRLFDLESKATAGRGGGVPPPPPGTLGTAGQTPAGGANLAGPERGPGAPGSHPGTRTSPAAEVELDLPDTLRLLASDAVVDRIEAIFGRGVVRFV
jgi:DNA polymerase-3 subunit alpha